jgi:manganese transport protein
MLIILQHNVAHLGIATGLCLSEAATIYTRPWVSRSILGTAMLASVSTSMAEILGGSIALKMLFICSHPDWSSFNCCICIDHAVYQLLSAY